MGVAVGEGVEACAEDDVLGNSVGDGGGEGVLGISAAGYEEGAEGGREGFMQAGSGLAEVFGVLAAEDGDGYGVDEHEGGRVEDLVRSTA